MEVLELKSKSIFQRYCEGDVKTDGKQLSILDCRDDVIFLWDDAFDCLLTQGLRSYCTTYQELHPTERPEFDVCCLTVNESGTRAVLWGAGGVAVMDLPWRCGSKMEFQGGKSQIITRCRTIEGLDLGYGAEVVQVRWNADSLNDSALFVLTSDNTLYHFDLLPLECSKIEVMSLGRRPTSRQRTLAALGETVVDFCFAPIFVETGNQKGGEAVFLVLRGNGDVNLIIGESNGFPETQSLPISPLPDDSYLSDACAILAVVSKPPAVILATTHGVVYHTLLVPFDVDQIDVPPRLRKYRLLVVESVVLDFDLLNTPDDLSVFPLRLLTDPTHPRRYLVTHPSGVHSIFLRVLLGVEESIKSSLHEPPPSKKMPQSSLEYLICTARPLQGCVAFPYSLIAIDAVSNVIAVPLRRIELPPFQLFTPDENNQSERGPLTRQMRQPFQQYLEQLLEESRVLPHIQLPNEDLPREQLLTLMVRMSNMVRKLTIPKLREVKTILQHRMQLVEAMRDLQVQELERLEMDRAAIQLAAETFAERVQMVSEDLEEHRERVQQAVRKVKEKHPTPTDAELRMELTLTEIEPKLQEYAASLEKLKKSRAYQEMKLEDRPERGQIVLGSKETVTIHSCLSVLGNNISQLVRRVNDMKELLGMSDD